MASDAMCDGSIPFRHTILVEQNRCPPKNPLFIADFWRSKAKNFRCKTIDAFERIFRTYGILTLAEEYLGEIQGIFEKIISDMPFLIYRIVPKVLKVVLSDITN